MSITISLKKGNEIKDIKIPTEWKDMTLSYWCGMVTIIKSHFYMTGLDKEDMNNVSLDSVTEVISVLDVLMEDYKPKGLTSFDYDNQTYYFPSEFLKQNTYGDYIESTQLDMYIDSMKHGRFDVLPEQMAILCRRLDEKYDDDIIPEKTENFKNLKMDIVWEFSFFLTQQNTKLAKLLSMYSEKNLLV
mgnify:CR=1 FL=1